MVFLLLVHVKDLWWRNEMPICVILMIFQNQEWHIYFTVESARAFQIIKICFKTFHMILENCLKYILKCHKIFLHSCFSDKCLAWFFSYWYTPKVYDGGMRCQYVWFGWFFKIKSDTFTLLRSLCAHFKSSKYDLKHFICY